MNNYCDWKEWVRSFQSTSWWFSSVNHYLWEFKILLKKLASCALTWQNIAGKSHIHGHKENRLKLFKSRRHFGEIILISRNEELYISKGAKKENALASEGKSCRPEKINMRFTSCQYEIYLISGQNSQLLTENVLLQSIIYPTEKTIHWNKQHFCMRWKSCVSYRSPFFSQAR